MTGVVRSKTLANRISEICICSLKKNWSNFFIFCEEILLIRKKVETVFDTFLTKITQIPSVAHRRSFPENHHMYGCRRVLQSSSMIIKSEKMNVSERVDIIRTKKNWDRVPRKKVVAILVFDFFRNLQHFVRSWLPNTQTVPDQVQPCSDGVQNYFRSPKSAGTFCDNEISRLRGPQTFSLGLCHHITKPCCPIFLFLMKLCFSTRLRGFFMPGGLWDRRILGAPRARCA